MAEMAESSYVHTMRRRLIIVLVVLLAIAAGLWIAVTSGRPDNTVVPQTHSPGASNPGVREGNDTNSTSSPANPTGNNSGGPGGVPLNP